MSRYNDDNEGFGDKLSAASDAVTRHGLFQYVTKNPKRVVAGAAALLLASQSIFAVTPNERANVRFLGGSPWYSTALGAGPHLKIPFLDHVDVVQTALTTQKINTIDVGTVDNQRVKLDINFNYTIPDSKVDYVLYKVGRAGNTDIKDQVERTVESVAVDIFAQQNMNNVNANLGSIRADMQKQIALQLYNLYGIQTQSLQISKVTPSDTFIATNEQAVAEKNKSIGAENAVTRVKAEAQQAAAKATGIANAQIAQATGNAESVRLNAVAEKTRLVLIGEGEEARLQAEMKPFGSADKYIKYLGAKAALQWRGNVPQVIAGATRGGGGASIIVPVPPAPAG